MNFNLILLLFCLIASRGIKCQQTFAEPEENDSCCFTFKKVNRNPDIRAEQFSGCETDLCCNKLYLYSKTSLIRLKQQYKRLKRLNSSEADFCRWEFHDMQLALMDSLPGNCSKRKLISYFGKPDETSKKFTEDEMHRLRGKIEPHDLPRKKIYRYYSDDSGRIYLLIVVSRGKVVYKIVYVDVC